MKELESIKVFQQCIMGHLIEIKNLPLTPAHPSSVKRSEEEQRFDTSCFPVKNNVELDIIETLLKNEGYFKSLVQYFKSVGGRNAKNMCSRILTITFSNDLACSFNWLGKSHNKSCFSTLLITRAIIRSMQETFTVTLKEVEDFIKNWLRHSASRVAAALKNHQPSMDLL